MRYVTSIERMALEKGLEQGMQQGMQQGVRKGWREGWVGLLSSQLEQRFGELPAWALERLASATDEDLKAWASALLSADSLATVFAARSS